MVAYTIICLVIVITTIAVFWHNLRSENPHYNDTPDRQTFDAVKQQLEVFAQNIITYDESLEDSK